MNQKRQVLSIKTGTILKGSADQLIVRKEYPQIPPKVEYSLSERGKSLMKVLDQLCGWGEENRLADRKVSG